jgi:hypothetical protein
MTHPNAGAHDAAVAPGQVLGTLRALADHRVVVQNDRTDGAQAMHLCIQHAIRHLAEAEP